MDWNLSGATTPSQSRPANDGNEGVFRIPQSSGKLFDCLVLYPGHWLEGVLPLCCEAVGVF